MNWRSWEEVRASCHAIACVNRRENPGVPFCKRCFGVLPPDLKLDVLGLCTEEPTPIQEPLHSKNMWIMHRATVAIMDALSTQGSKRAKGKQGSRDAESAASGYTR